MNELVLVTGAAGFIGSHLAESLVDQGYRVRAMVHYNFQNNWGWLDTLPRDILDNMEVVSMDITDPFSVNQAVAGASIVFHLASLIGIPYSYRAPASYVDTNVKGTMNVLQACMKHDVARMVHTSTSETYGTAQYVPIDENHPLVGQSPYAATKIAADKLVESYHHSFELPAVTVRPFNTFGPRQSARAVIPTILAQVLSGRETIHLGALDPIRDLNYVKDTTAGFIAAARADNAIGTVINLGRGEGISIGELASLILQITGSSAFVAADETRQRPENSEVQQLICDNTRARELLGWAPRSSLEEALKETVDWFRDNLRHYKSDIYNI